jgi:hypothetical protein
MELCNIFYEEQRKFARFFTSIRKDCGESLSSAQIFNMRGFVMRNIDRLFSVACVTVFCAMVAGEEPTPAPDAKPTESIKSAKEPSAEVSKLKIEDVDAGIKVPFGSRHAHARVKLACQWLANNQEADGHFDAKKCQAMDQSDTVATSLMLLTFLGSGQSEKVGDYKQNVKNGIAWLIKHQTDDGCVTDLTDTNNPQVLLPPQALATMALCAAAPARIATTKAAAQKAVDYCLTQQEHVDSKRHGWGFTAKAPSDMRATIWYVLALQKAKICHLKVEHEAFEGIQRFLDTVEHKNIAQMPSGPASVYWRTAKIEEPEQSHVLTVMGTLARQIFNGRKEDLLPTAEWFISKGGIPVWEKSDPVYWYLGTLCAFNQGGDVWKNWNEGLKKILENQIKEDDAAASWNINWGNMLIPLSLNVFYCYVQLYPE